MARPTWKYLAGYNTFDGDLGATLGGLVGGSTPASGTWPNSNTALFVPMYINQAVLVKRLYTVNGAAVSGNIDVGIYTQDGARIVSSGSTAQAGTNAPQFFDITDLLLSPGRYYLAVALDNATGALFRSNAAQARLQGLGMARQASAFPLPTSATFAAIGAGYMPLIGMEILSIL